MKRKNRYAMLLAVAMLTCSAMPAIAEENGSTTTPTESTGETGNENSDTETKSNGVQTGKQYIESDGTTTTVRPFGGAGTDANADGKVHLSYDTTGGKWYDEGNDGPDGANKNPHDNGTYTVTIPTLILYENMNVGKVNTSDDYTVNVKGTIPADNIVFVSAETGNLVANGAESITETTTQGKKQWTAKDCYGSMNTDGSLSGTDSTDTIALSGEAKSVGTFTGSVQYTTELKKLQSNISFMDYLSDNDVPLSSVVKHTSNGEAVYNDYHKLGSWHGRDEGWFGDSITISNYDGIIDRYSNIAMTFALQSFQGWGGGDPTSKASAYVTYADGTNSETVVVSVYRASGSRTMNLSIDPDKTVKEIHINTGYHDGLSTDGYAWMTDMVLS